MTAVETARIDNLTEKLDHLNCQLNKFAVLVSGNGDPAKGLVLKVDRLDHVSARDSDRLDDLEREVSRLSVIVATLESDAKGRRAAALAVWGALLSLGTSLAVWAFKVIGDN